MKKIKITKEQWNDFISMLDELGDAYDGNLLNDNCVKTMEKEIFEIEKEEWEKEKYEGEMVCCNISDIRKHYNKAIELLLEKIKKEHIDFIDLDEITEIIYNWWGNTPEGNSDLLGLAKLIDKRLRRIK